MPKKIFEDMVRVKRAKKRDSSSSLPIKEEEKIEKPNKRKTKEPIPSKKPQKKPKAEEKKISQNTKKEEMVRDTVNPVGKDSRYHKPSSMIWFLAFVSMVVFLFVLSLSFSKAIVTIVPLEENITINRDFYAVLDSNTALPFDLVVIEGQDEKAIVADGRQEFEEVAIGTAVIYNDYSTASQTLLIDTRLEGSNGMIYMTEERIVVPGQSSDGTPGSIEVGVYASEPGESYNSGPLDFKIVGFEGGPKYDGFYARSTSDISGGLVGYLPVISQEQREQAIEELKQSLKQRLAAKAKEQIPEGFVLFDEAVYLEIQNQEVDLSAEGDSVPVKVQGTLYGFLFEKAELESVIIENELADKYEDADIFIPDWQNVTFSMANMAEKTQGFSEINSINFNLSGRQKAVWRVDEEAIISDLLGEKKKEFTRIMLDYSSVSSADLTLKPIWKRAIPEDPRRIRVDVKYPSSGS